VEEIGPYQIQQVLARGGMGVVYKAFDTRLKRAVALKMVLSGQHADPAAYARFRSEAEAIARLQHPNIVQIYEVGEHEGLPYFALEFVEGPSLYQVLSNGALPARIAAELALALARAIEFAHERGIIHRDLKPGNILLQLRSADRETHHEKEEAPSPASEFRISNSEFRVPKITDFGLAKLRGRNDTYTQPGEVIGTPNYMAPEQAEGDPAGIGPVADVYALGAVLYEMLTGQPPFQGTTPLETLMWVRLREPIPPTHFNRNLPRDLETICLKCLRKERHRRYASAAALAEDLDRLLTGQPILARPVGLTERLWKWTRRHPALGGLVLLFLSFVLVANIVVFLQWRKAEDAREQMQKQFKQLLLAREQASRTSAELERTIYELRLSSAEREWLTEDAVRARAKLNECPDELRNWEWRYLRRRFEGSALTMPVRPGEPLTLTMLLDQGRLLLIHADGQMRFCDPISGQVVETKALQVPEGMERTEGYQNGTFCADQSRVALAFSATLRGAPSPVPHIGIWETKSGRLLRCWPCAAIQFTLRPDGKEIVWTSGWWTERDGRFDWYGGEVRILNLESGETRQLLQADRNSIVGCSYSPDGRTLALTGRQMPLLIYAADSGKKPMRGLEPEHYCHKVLFDPSGQQVLLLGGNDVFAYSIGGKRHGVLKGHRALITQTAFSHNGRWLATASNDNTIRLWDLNSLQEVDVLVGHGEAVGQIAFSGDDCVLASHSVDGTVKLWELRSEMQPPSFGRGAHKDWVPSVVFMPGGRQLLSVCGDKHLRLWDWKTGALRQTIPCRESPEHAALSPDGKTLAVAYDYQGGIGLWDVATWTETRQLHGHTAAVSCVAFSTDGQLLASTSEDGSARVWDLASGRQLTEFRRHVGQVSWIQFHPSEKLVASGGEDGTVRIWDPLTGEERNRIPAHPTRVTCLAFSPNGRWLASANTDRERPDASTSIQVFDTRTWECRRTLSGHVRSIWFLAFSPDNSRLVSTGEDNSVRVWDPEYGRLLLSLKGHADDVRCAVFHPSGNLLVSSGDEPFVCCWDATPLDQPPAARMLGR
jgi:WD40 repeat protein